MVATELPSHQKKQKKSVVRYHYITPACRNSWPLEVMFANVMADGLTSTQVHKPKIRGGGGGVQEPKMVNSWSEARFTADSEYPKECKHCLRCRVTQIGIAFFGVPKAED